jgi:phosphate-selective porin O and P
MDAGVFGADQQQDLFASGVAIPDVRMGLGAKYGNWKAKIDIGYAFNKLSPKDILIEYLFSKHTLLRGGYFVHQFGMQSATSSSFKISMEEPQSNNAFFNGRLVGLMLLHQKDAFMGTLSIFAENEAMKQSSDKTGSQGVGMMSRLLYRPMREGSKRFHIGISGAWETPRYNKEAGKNHSSYVLETPFPTRIAKVTAQQANIDNATFLYTDLSNSKAGILGGRLNDYSLTFNYYINKYMIWRVRTSYTAVGYRAGKDNTNLSLIENRLQIKF